MHPLQRRDLAQRRLFGEAEHLWTNLPEDRRRQVCAILADWLVDLVRCARVEVTGSEYGEGDR